MKMMKHFFQKYRWQLSFAVVIIIAIATRFYQLGQVPTSLYWDEAAMLVDAKTVSQTGADMHGRSWYQLLYPSYGDYKLPVYIWLASVSVKLFGVTEWALRLPSALAGLGTVIMGGLIARQLFNERRTQLMTMLVLALSPWAMMFSRTAFEGHVAQLWFSISVWMLLKSRRHLGWLLGGTFFGILATYTYFSVRFVWPVVLVGVGLSWLLPKILLAKRKKLNLRATISQIGLHLVLPLVIFGLGLLPMIKSEFYHESQVFRYGTNSVLNYFNYPLTSNIYRQLAGESIIDRFFFHRHLLLLRELANNVFDHLSLNYLFVSGDSNLRHGTGEHGLFLLPLLPFFIAGLYQLFNKQRRVSIILICWWLAALIPAAVPETTPHALRSLNGLVPLAIIISSGISYFWLKWRRVTILLGLIWLIMAGEFFWYYFNIYPEKSAPDWQQNYREMAITLEEYHDQADEVYLSGVDDKLYLWILAYGDYDGAEIQQLQSSNFHLKTFQKYHTTPYKWKNFAEMENGVVLIDSPNKIRERLEAKAGELEVVRAKDFYGNNGADYQIIHIKPL